MEGFTDSDNNELEKRFYKWGNDIFYFTGNYDPQGFPLFYIENDSKETIYHIYKPLVKELKALCKEDLEKIIQGSPEKKGWIERIISISI